MNKGKIIFFWKKNKWFTLVELIIVITIISILAIIAFISFQNYTKDSRDANRISTIKNFETWIDLYALKAWKVPNQEEITWTWIIDWVITNYVWYIKDTISKQINMNKTPKDPLYNSNYIYWISSDFTKYQIATIMEWDIVYQKLISTTYANKNIAKLIWNYKYPLKLWNKIYSLPSLIFVWWEIWSLTNFTWFIIDKWFNSPYDQLNNTNTITDQLKDITWKDNISLTWIEIPNNLSIDDFKILDDDDELIIKIIDEIWLDNKNDIWKIIYWDIYARYNWETTKIKNLQTTPEVCFWFNNITKTITSYDYNNPICTKDLVFPDKIWWVNIENIWENSFCINNSCWEENRWYIETIVLNNSLKTIWDWAFEYNNIKNVILSNNLEFIWTYAFWNNFIEKVNMPLSVFNINNTNDDKLWSYIFWTMMWSDDNYKEIGIWNNTLKFYSNKVSYNNLDYFFDEENENQLIINNFITNWCNVVAKRDGWNKQYFEVSINWDYDEEIDDYKLNEICNKNIDNFFRPPY